MSSLLDKLLVNIRRYDNGKIYGVDLLGIINEILWANLHEALINS